MGGIWVGGKYVPGCGKVTLFISNSNKWCYINMKKMRNHTLTKFTVDKMVLSAPELLAFWSEEE